MRILQLNKFITINGGSEIVMKNLAELLELNGHSVINVGFHKADQTLIDNSVDLGQEIILFRYLFYSSCLVQKIVNEIVERDIDLVICHNIYHHFPIWQLLSNIKKYTRAKLCLFLHDYKVVCPTYNLLLKNEVCFACSNKKFLNCALNKCKENSFFKSFAIYLESLFNNKILDAYLWPDVIISPSFFLRNQVKSMGFSHAIEVLHNPLPESIQVQNTHKRKNRILFVGRLSNEKGITQLLTIAGQLKEFDLHVIGNGPLKDLVLDACAKHTNITYGGYQTNASILENMSEAKYLIVPSIWYENNPMVILEAFSVGLPVLGSNLGGIPELVGSSRGAIFDPFNTESVISIVRNMMSISSEDYEKNVLSCKVFAEDRKFPSYYKNFKNLLKEVITFD